MWEMGADPLGGVGPSRGVGGDESSASTMRPAKSNGPANGAVRQVGL